MRLLRVLAGAAAAALAWWAGLVVVFGPAQFVLADPSRQSAKFLSAFAEPPLPRMAEGPGVLAGGLFLVALVHSSVYAWLGPRLPGGAIRRGLVFGLLAWALMVPWFEFYLPWNVMREPLPLVLLEMLCWLGVLLGVGLSLSFVYGVLGRNARGSASSHGQTLP